MSMQAMAQIDPGSLLDTAISLAAAFVLGMAIGYERQVRQRTAGLRTNVLVAVGAAIFVDMGNRLTGAEGAVHIAAYVVSGIGFLGAGSILREGGGVRGLNTAATVWGSGAVGACAGADLIGEAALGACCVLAANTLLRPVAMRINRRPAAMDAVEERVPVIHVVLSRADRGAVLELIETAFEEGGLPPHELRVSPFGTGELEVQARLGEAPEDDAPIEAVVARLAAHPSVSTAYWTVSGAEAG
ncbi:MAG: MgtC/SapB family protein [Burkholderiales bacterium]|jgi:putative Mg2+ transporter-C (MgtC) family protein